MVESKRRNGTARESVEVLGRALTEAVDAGITEEELLLMVVSAMSTTAPEQAVQGPSPEPEPIYEHGLVPRGLIDLPSAAQKYGRPISTLQAWVRRGHLATYGRLKAPARGGGYVLLLEADVIDKTNGPIKKGGRPRKIPVE